MLPGRKVIEAKSVPFFGAITGHPETANMINITPIDKPVGTSIIKGLINSDQVVTITESSSGNSTQANGIAAANGKGTGSTIEYDPNGKGSSIVNTHGSKGRPSKIGLGHELIHAKSNADGKTDFKLELEKTDPDTGKKGILTKDEINTRKLDSQIRKEV